MTKGKIRLGIVGVGNCASALVQGIEYYKDARPGDDVPGLMHVLLGDYHVRDVEVACAFDVDAKKVGRDVAEAIFSEPNNTIRFAEDVPPTGVEVLRGPTLDGLGKYYRETIDEADGEAVDVAQALRDAQVDVVVSYLPVGSEEATQQDIKWLDDLIRAERKQVKSVKSERPASRRRSPVEKERAG